VLTAHRASEVTLWATDCTAQHLYMPDCSTRLTSHAFTSASQVALKGAQDPSRSYGQLKAASSSSRLAEQAALAMQRSADFSDDLDAALPGGWVVGCGDGQVLPSVSSATSVCGGRRGRCYCGPLLLWFLYSAVSLSICGHSVVVHHRSLLTHAWHRVLACLLGTWCMLRLRLRLRLWVCARARRWRQGLGGEGQGRA
jgi:hypothetical protein